MKTKKITVQAHIWHGDYNEKIQASGETVSECISKMAKTNGYVAEPNWNEYSKKMVSELEATGKGALGWVNYEVIEETRPTLETVTYTLPAYWASYLINGDASGIGDDDKRAADKFISDNSLPAPVSCSDESWFDHSNDAGTLAGDVL